MLQNVKEHLLMFTSGDSLACTTAVLEKIRSNFGDIPFLEKMLYNKDYHQYFNLLGSRDITRNFEDISSNLYTLVNKDPILERNIMLLPYNTLFALLSSHRREIVERDGSWTYENLVDSPLKMYISGLSCSDVKHLEITDFMPVIGYYVRHRRALGQTFPKDMQRCVESALMQYLKMKSQLRGIRHESFELLHLLEPYEVKAVGGYVLAGLPSDVVISLPSKQQIISEIGKLTVPELLTSSPLKHIKTLANSYYMEPTTYHLQAITDLGNLVWFLGDENIRRLDTADFKLFLESQEENSVRSLCLNERERDSWRLFLIDVLGNPETWSSGTLMALGDLLVVFDNYELGRINKTSWAEAGDVLSQSTSYLHSMEWPGRTKFISLYEACLDVLDDSERPSFKTSVKNLLRLYLEAAQFLLDTVAPSERLSKSDEPSSIIEEGEVVGKLHFAPTLLENQGNNVNTDVVASGRVANVSENSSAARSESEPKPNDDETVKFRSTGSPTTTTTTTEAPSGAENKTDSLAGLETSTEIDSNKAFEDDRNLSDMVQGDQEFEGDDDDYDYENDNPSYDDYQQYDVDSGNEHVEAVHESESEASERLKRLLLYPFTFFSKIKDKIEDSSSQNNEASSRRKRSINNLEKSPEVSGTGDKLSVYKSQESKSLEEKKEELRKHSSRDLVIEVPVNTTGRLDFNSPSKKAINITCDAIKILGKSSSLVLDKEDIASMSDIELEDCSEVLGSLELEQDLKQDIWKRLSEWKKSGNLLEVGNLVSAVEEHDLPDIELDLSQPWGYENLNALSTHISDPFLMSQASDEFLTKNSKLTTLSYESASALGRLICTMTLAHQKKLLLSQNHVFVNAAPVLGSTIECDNKIFESCMYQLAKISTSEGAFGRTENWDANDVSTLGVIVAGLSREEINDGNGNGLKPEAFAGLTPAAMSCMSSDTLKVLSEEQLSHVPALAAASLSQSQMSSLSPSQFAVLDRIRRQITQEELEQALSSGAGKLISTFTLYLSVTVYITYNFRFIVRTFC